MFCKLGFTNDGNSFKICNNEAKIFHLIHNVVTNYCITVLYFLQIYMTIIDYHTQEVQFFFQRLVTLKIEKYTNADAWKTCTDCYRSNWWKFQHRDHNKYLVLFSQCAPTSIWSHIHLLVFLAIGQHGRNIRNAFSFWYNSNLIWTSKNITIISTMRKLFIIPQL